MIEKAYKIILEAFYKKVDKAGEPYIFHLQRVAKPFANDECLYTIALLHDILEDCPEWSFELLSEVFPPIICHAVLALTKKEGEVYEAYLHRVAQNEFARKVKISDLQDNMNLSRIKRSLTTKELERTEKYHKAYLYLSNF